MNNKKSFRATEIFSSASQLLFLNLLASVLNYAYQIVLARVMSVQAFGTMYIVFSLLLILAVPGTTFTMIAAKKIADSSVLDSQQHIWHYIQDLTKKVMFFSIGVFAVGLLLSHPLCRILKIESNFIVLTVITVCALSYFHPLYSGCMSGLKKFLLLGLYTLAIPLYKFIGLIFVVPIQNENGKLLAVLLSIIAGSIITAAVGYYYFRKKLDAFHWTKSTENVSYDKSLWMESFIINICFSIYINIDVFVVRHIGGETVSGLYSVATLFGKMIYYCATSVGTVLLPAVATVNEADSRKLLKKTMLMICGLSGVGLLLLNCLKTPLVLFLYGESYLPAIDYIGYVSLISFSIGLLAILTNYFVGISKTRQMKNVLLFLCACASVTAFLSDDVGVALMLIGLSGLLCDGYLIASYFVREKSK